MINDDQVAFYVRKEEIGLDLKIVCERDLAMLDSDTRCSCCNGQVTPDTGYMYITELVQIVDQSTMTMIPVGSELGEEILQLFEEMDEAAFHEGCLMQKKWKDLNHLTKAGFIPDNRHYRVFG